VAFFAEVIALEFLISSAILLFLVPQLTFHRNKLLYGQLKTAREETHQILMEGFRGRIEIAKYNLEEKAIARHEQMRQRLEQLEKKIQTNSFYLQLIAGLGFSYVATFLLWHSGRQEMDAPLAIGIFFGIMAQAELAEMLFSGKSEKSAVEQQIDDIQSIIREGTTPQEPVAVATPLEQLKITDLEAVIPGTPGTGGAAVTGYRTGRMGSPLRRDGQGQNHSAEQPLLPGVPESGDADLERNGRIAPPPGTGSHLRDPESLSADRDAAGELRRICR
jgi:ATP-binding cassette subfamily C protein CydC